MGMHAEERTCECGKLFICYDFSGDTNCRACLVTAERARCVALVKPYEWMLTDRGSEEQDQFRAMLAAIESPKENEPGKERT